MPRDWPDPRWPPEPPIRWYEWLFAIAATLAALIAIVRALWPG